MTEKHVLIILGGTWHDFDGFTAAMKPVFEAAEYTVEATYDLGVLSRLAEGQTDVALFYTCLGERRDDGGPTAPGPTETQAAALVEWVRGGGALLAAHAATVMGQSSPALAALMGGVFVTHPPQFAFTVYPLYCEHPIIAGIEAFTVHDEFYVEACEPTVEVHMVALDRSVAHPMVWSKGEGKGRVAHVALGHGPEVWNLAPYQRLMHQTLDWLTAG